MPTISDSNHVRHHHHSKTPEFEKLQKNFEVQQSKLEDIMEIIETKLTPPGNVENRLRKLEELEKIVERKMFNVSKHVAELDRLRLSLLQLLESVETLETKVDTELPSLQREISKMEFGVAENSATVSMLKEHQVSLLVVDRRIIIILPCLHREISKIRS